MRSPRFRNRTARLVGASIVLSILGSGAAGAESTVAPGTAIADDANVVATTGPPTSVVATTGPASSTVATTVARATDTATKPANKKTVTKKTIAKSATPTATTATTSVSAPAIGAPRNDDDVWAKLRACESGGNYALSTGNGYYGAYQFAPGTWRALGYPGLPHEAPPTTQDEAARKLQARAGWGQWPACTRKLGLR